MGRGSNKETQARRAYKVRRIVEARKENGLSQSQIASAIGVSQTCYCKYETGRVSIPLDTVIALARIYGTTADFLLGETDDPVSVRQLYPRNIMFRGKGPYSGEWFRGDHSLYKAPHGTVVHAIDGIVVDPLSIGEFTGLSDINGTQIFEGDILKYEEIVNGKKLRDKYGVVKFGKHSDSEESTTEIGWYIEWYPVDTKPIPDYRNDILFWVDPKWHERYNNPAVVVGNFFDNGSLIMGAK